MTTLLALAAVLAMLARRGGVRHGDVDAFSMASAILRAKRNGWRNEA